ncbi:LOW QUALITY PROTEIN: mitochondrial GTPase 1-like [Tachypleus tridentatus]|uniref:LOW QUALITY PROTEIN: mitochondrial GTPase 1-like n=1 Tax=Tachypleus tridentatus TaxID=6853 RepID=UPI003FD50B5C
MASKISSIVPKFRESYTVANKDLSKWFPGHMYKGMKQMQQKLKMVDCILEVHDARIPFSGRNPNFYHLLTAVKPHILVLNKVDLADVTSQKQIEQSLKQQGINQIIFTNCKDQKDRGLKKVSRKFEFSLLSYDSYSHVLPTVTDLVTNSERYNRTESKEFHLMAIGVPNVGKSSLINMLRNLHLKKGKASRVGALAGITRSVLERIKISEDPPIYLLDTPGILAPNIKNVEVGLRLALCATVRDHLIGEDLIADYLLYWLNKHQNFFWRVPLFISNPEQKLIKER